MVVTMAQDLVVVLMFRLTNSNDGGNRCGSLNGACKSEECGDKDVSEDNADIYGGGGVDNLLLVSRGHCVETRMTMEAEKPWKLI